jgi:hypothetical protein
MDELTVLRRAREDVQAVEPQALADARRRLMVVATAKPRRSRPRTLLLVPATAAACLLVALTVGLWPGGQQTATAAEVLRAASTASSRTADPVTGPGQYLEVTTREKSLGYVTGEAGGGVVGAYVVRPVQTVWVPHDRATAWVSRSYSLAPGNVYGDEAVRRAAARDFAESATAQHPVLERAAGGAFGNGELGGGEDTSIGVDDLASLPRDGRALLDRLSNAPGVPEPRGDKVMSQVATLLRSGLVPHDLRAAMYDALALLPGVVITDDQASLDGRTGTAIGVRSSTGYELDEVIIDPETGDYLGQRQTQLVREGAVPAGTVMDSTSVSVRVVDQAP